jgi:hypothetical protein
MDQQLSSIQNHIIAKLKNAKLLRYSEIQPKDVPNDLFNYHLQFLVKKGLVARSEEGYALAQPGIRRVADTEAEHLFKVNVITIVSRKTENGLEILNQMRTSHPSFGKIGVMGGVVKKGEPLETAAARKLKSETGLEASFRVVGIERRMMYVSGELFSDIVFPIAYADNSNGVLQEDTKFGHNMWLPIEEAIENESIEFDSIKKIVDVLGAIKDKKISKLPFFYEEDIQKQ